MSSKNIQNNIDGKYAIFILHEKSYLGGLGDRLGGLISAFAYAIRTNRTFLIEADPSFHGLFSPYHPNGTLTWSDDFTWAGLTPPEALRNNHHQNTINCINPKPREVKCALDHDRPETKVLRIRLNRSYLCRWLINPALKEAQEELKILAGVDSNNDLFEVAGCMMRLAMWPTSKLWTILESEFARSLVHISSPIRSLLSLHFRCGDLNFKNKGNKELLSSSCKHSENWNGVDFGDARSLDSPLDMTQCAHSIRNVTVRPTSTNVKTHTESDVIYIASDNSGAIEQMNQSLSSSYNNNNIYVPSSASCHFDLDKSGSCSSSTLISWFTLAISDKIILQSIDESDTYYIKGIYKKDTFTAASAFSRYAGIYSLSASDGGLYFAKNCTALNTSTLSYITEGNWVCRSNIFY